MEDLQRLYPIGIQTFSKIREGNFLYVDKTEYVYRMTHSASSYMFLSRPRRFGKSLLTSTLHSYFSGREELFRGLAMEKLEKDWIPTEPETSLYLRPVCFATQASVGVEAADEYKFFIVACPVKAYHTGFNTDDSCWVETKYSRASEGGTGGDKCGCLLGEAGDFSV